jgi:hypothetical protein
LAFGAGEFGCIEWKSEFSATPAPPEAVAMVARPIERRDLDVAERGSARRRS